MQGRTPDALFPPEDIPNIMRQHESGHRYGRHRSEFYLPRKDEANGAGQHNGSQPPQEREDRLPARTLSVR